MTTYPYLLFAPLYTGDCISGARPVCTITAPNPEAAIKLATRLWPDQQFLCPAHSTYFLHYRAQATGLPHLDPADAQTTFLAQEKPARAANHARAAERNGEISPGQHAYHST